jgi:K+-transporting ATPase ATPase C chain
MKAHLRANLWLLVLTVVIASVIYPGVLLGLGQSLFREKAQGSLIVDSQGNAIGSRLIAQPFSDAKYFQPRPSAVSYNAAATGGTNWGPSNPALRKRVMAQLGTVLKYRDGGQVGPDIEKWARDELKADRKVLVRWQEEAPDSAGRWAVADGAVTEFLTKWAEVHADEVAKARGPDAASATPADLAPLYFTDYAEGRTDAWPETSGKDLQVAFFEVWWKHHPDADFESVPSDMVLASGSGIDPDITRDAALYQLDRVAAAWAQEKNGDPSSIKQDVKNLIEKQARAPFDGLVGVPLVNVLELNLAVRNAMESGAASGK